VDSLFPPALGVPTDGWFATHADGADMDLAFDLALDRALHAWGDAGVPELDPATLVVLDEAPCTLAQAVRVAHAGLAAGHAAVAVPYLPPKAFRRKPARIVLDGLDRNLPAPGPVALPGDELLGVLQERLDEICATQDLGLHRIDSIQLTRRVVRSRAQAARVVGKSRKQFAVMEGDRILAVFPKQAEARAFGLGLARSDERDEASWELWALTGRDSEEGWAPLVHLLRRRRTQRGVFKVIGVQAREQLPQLAGWVFACALDASSDLPGDTPVEAATEIAAVAAGTPDDAATPPSSEPTA
jgi:hypothetical protein